MAGGAALVWPSVEKVQVEVIKLGASSRMLSLTSPLCCLAWGAVTLRSLIGWPVGGSIFILMLTGGRLSRS